MWTKLVVKNTKKHVFGRLSVKDQSLHTYVLTYTVHTYIKTLTENTDTNSQW